jgi:hypothetical protein
LVAELRAAVVGVFVASVLVLTVFLSGGHIQQASGGTVTINGVQYSVLSTQVSFPDQCNPPSVNGTTSSDIFDGVNFSFRVAYACSPGGGELAGSGQETNGTLDSFAIAGIPGPSEWVSWISPDTHYGVQWNRGTGVELLVAQTPVTIDY